MTLKLVKNYRSIMKKLLIISLLVIAALNCQGQDIGHLTDKNSKIDTFKVIEPSFKEAKVNKLITFLLSRYHYKKAELNDSLSSVIFDNYIKMLDYSKLYFLKSDIESFEKYRYQFDDLLKQGDLHPAFTIFNVFKTRLNDRMNYIVNRLEKPFDFTIDENYMPDRKDADYASTIKEQDELWRKRLKNDALNLKLSGKEGKAAGETLAKRYKGFHKSLLQYDDEDVFQLYMNAFAEAVDPHTSYFSPITSDNFNISMQLSLEGIGAQLTLRDDYTTIVNIIPGGPADKDGRLKEDDKIVSVAQGDTGEFVDVVGWPIDDVVQLIRGDKGTKVRLQIMKAGNTIDMPLEEIDLTRDKVKLEEQAAKSETFDVEENGKKYKFGVIDIPKFYIDFKAKSSGDPDYKSTTRDVKKLIDTLKTEGIDGLIIDLRNNGGGSLQEAIDLTGLFIKTGPVVQVKDSQGEIEIDKDPDPDIYYDGPLTILINRFSASASEIFSGAIQDYGRGLIVGEQSYGKGTVQNIYPLDRFIPAGDEKLGDLKITIAKFYRITGGSTQHLGVIPDIAYPSPFHHEDVGESSHPSALRWDEIAPVKFDRYGDLSQYVDKLEKLHEARMKDNKEIQYILEDYAEIESRRDKNEYSLLESVRKADREKAEAIKKARDEDREKNKDMKVIDKKEVPVRDVKIDDPFLDETGHILADYISMRIG